MKVCIDIVFVLVYITLALGKILDHLDYVNGIGNRSREPYVCIEQWLHTLCYSRGQWLC